MNWTLRRDVLPLLLIIVLTIGALYFYPGLPDMIPSHFSGDGNADSFSPKATVIWLNVGSAIVLYLVLTFIPLVDPFWKRIQNRYSIFLFFRDVVIAFLVFIFLVTMYAAHEQKFPVHLLGVGLGILLLVLGNYLPRLPRNFFFGIRSPWTLASEIVWKRTHQVGGWTFVLAGILIAVVSLFEVNMEIVLYSTLLPVILFVGILYPFFLFKKLQKEDRITTPDL